MAQTQTYGMTEVPYGMSNFDYIIDPELERALKRQPNRVYGTHAGQDFNGRVWFDGVRFKEEVWRHGTPVEVVSAASLRELLAMVNDRYGRR